MITFSNISTILLISFLSLMTCNAQNENRYNENTDIEQISPSPYMAHPKAKELLVEDFYWDPSEESGPFGSDDGVDAFYGLQLWRQQNKTSSLIIFLEQLITDWGYTPFDWNEMDTVKIYAHLSRKTEIEIGAPELIELYNKTVNDSDNQINQDQFIELFAIISSSMNESSLIGQDNAIIALGFGQFILEGKIDEDIKSLTKTAIKRQLLPLLLNRWNAEYIATRQEQLNKMLSIIDKMND